MALIRGGNAPYAPSATVIETITRYRERGMATPITTDVLERAGIPESLTPRTLASLKLLGILDGDGNPTPDFEKATRSPDDEYKEKMRDLLIDTYGEVLSFADPAKNSCKEPGRVPGIQPARPAGPNGDPVPRTAGVRCRGRKCRVGSSCPPHDSDQRQRSYRQEGSPPPPSAPVSRPLPRRNSRSPRQARSLMAMCRLHWPGSCGRSPVVALAGRRIAAMSSWQPSRQFSTSACQLRESQPATPPDSSATEEGES